tara:strand:- start:564 stop:956 length:393 start_codon:yes stop_codon:yes gene_type:complete
MSKGLSPKLPLAKDPQDGYALNKEYVELVQQNLKMILLTAPGERIMEPEFGVGLRNYLFQNNTKQTQRVIDSKIREQVALYMPFVEVISVQFSAIFDESGTNENGIHMNLEFRIIPFDIFTSLEINTSTN